MRFPRSRIGPARGRHREAFTEIDTASLRIGDRPRCGDDPVDFEGVVVARADETADSAAEKLFFRYFHPFCRRFQERPVKKPIYRVGILGEARHRLLVGPEGIVSPARDRGFDGKNLGLGFEFVGLLKKDRAPFPRAEPHDGDKGLSGHVPSQNQGPRSVVRGGSEKFSPTDLGSVDVGREENALGS